MGSQLLKAMRIPGNTVLRLAPLLSRPFRNSSEEPVLGSRVVRPFCNSFLIMACLLGFDFQEAGLPDGWSPCGDAFQGFPVLWVPSIVQISEEEHLWVGMPLEHHLWAGMPSEHYDRRGWNPSRIVGSTLKGEAIRSPLAAGQMLWPRAVEESPGTVRFFWGQIDGLNPDTVLSSDLPLVVDRLVTATWSRGQGWSETREVLVRPGGIRMGRSGMAAVAAGRPGTAYYVVSRHNRFRDGLFFVRTSGDEVYWTEIPASGTGAVTMAADKEKVALLFTQPDWTLSQPVGRAVLTVSLDKGNHWSPLMEVPSSPSDNDQIVGVVLGPSDTIHAVWSTDPGGGVADGLLFHAKTSDQGGTWSPPDTVAIPGAWASNLKVFQSESGVVHAVFVLALSGRLVHIKWGENTKTVNVDVLPHLFTSNLAWGGPTSQGATILSLLALPRAAIPAGRAQPGRPPPQLRCFLIAS